MNVGSRKTPHDRRRGLKFKIGLILFLFCVALGGAVYFFSRSQRPIEEFMAAAVTVGDGCTDSNFPVRVSLTNDAYSTTVALTGFEITVKQVGRSRRLASDKYESDLIIEPGKTQSLCVKQPWERQRTLERLAQGDFTGSMVVNIDDIDEVPEADRIYSIRVNWAIDDEEA
jgi:hypothetical protein